MKGHSHFYVASRAGDCVDGSLVVTDALGRVHWCVPPEFATLPMALERWDAFCSYVDNAAAPSVAAPDSEQVMGPVIRRNYQALYASAFGNRGARVAQGAQEEGGLNTSLLMYQGSSDWFLGNGEAFTLADERYELDLEPEIGIIVGNVPQGTSPDDAHGHILLVTMCNDFTYRTLIREEKRRGFGFVQGKPLTSMAPMACTPAALGNAWERGRLQAKVHVKINGELFGIVSSVDMEYSFADLVAHAAATRPLRAGTFISSGTISSAKSSSVASIVEMRIGQVAAGLAPRSYLKAGDRVSMTIYDVGGRSLFGTLENHVVPIVRTLSIHGHENRIHG